MFGKDGVDLVENRFGEFRTGGFLIIVNHFHNVIGTTAQGDADFKQHIGI
jgi:hypothetical protein